MKKLNGPEEIRTPDHLGVSGGIIPLDHRPLIELMKVLKRFNIFK